MTQPSREEIRRLRAQIKKSQSRLFRLIESFDEDLEDLQKLCSHPERTVATCVDCGQSDIEGWIAKTQAARVADTPN